MKKKLIVVIIALCILIVLGMLKQKEKATIICATDLHYISDRINDRGELFQKIVNSTDGKLAYYSEEIIDAFLAEVIETKPDVLILSGDLTFEGAKASHEDLVKKLSTVKEAGVPVLVIAGNHDIDSNSAYQYQGSEYEKAENINAEEFAQLYYEFGLKDAISKDEYSLSYLYQLNDDLYILMLDTNAYGQNFIQDPSYEWIEDQLKMIKDQKADVITVSHQNLFAHNDMLSFGYQLYDGDELLELLNRYDVRCHLSGHIHLQHYQTDGVCEIVTSSLLVPPNQYGVILYNGSYDYHTKPVDVSSWARKNGITDENLLDFSNYASSFYQQVSAFRTMKRLADYNLSDDELNAVLKAFGVLNESYFAGNKLDINEIREGIDIIRSHEGFASRYFELMIEEAANSYTSIKIK